MLKIGFVTLLSVFGFFIGAYTCFILSMDEKITVMVSGIMSALVFAIGGIKLANLIMEKYHLPVGMFFAIGSLLVLIGSYVLYSMLGY